MTEVTRPEGAAHAEAKNRTARGKLMIYFGYAQGVGKTYAMLADAKAALARGVDVVAGYIAPRANQDILDLLGALPALPPASKVDESGARAFDLDGALARMPRRILIDELAHVNVAGARNKRRYQDVEELLNAGIDVCTTLDVCELESLHELAEEILKTAMPAVPDHLFARAEIKLIDIRPDALLARQEAAGAPCLLSPEALAALREIALRKALEQLSNARGARALPGKALSLRLMVLVGASPSSERCIRWAARTAEAFRAPWVAVHVQAMERVSPAEGETLRRNLDLARTLGGEVVTLNGYDVAATAAQYALLSGITNIVVGKSRNEKTMKTLFEPDFEDRLIALIPDVEVHIIPGSAVDRYKKESAAPPRSDWIFSAGDAAKTLAILSGATAISYAVRSLGFGDESAIMLYILSVLLVSRLTSGYLYGLIASLLSVLAFDFFFISPHFSFSALSRYPVSLAIMLAVALTTSALTVRIKAQMALALDRERRRQVVYEVSKRFVEIRGLDNIATQAGEYLVRLLDRSAILYIGNPALEENGRLAQAPGEDASFLATASERTAARWVFINGKPAGANTDTLSDARALYLPFLSQGRALGAVGVSFAKGPLDEERELMLNLVVAQVSVALERQDLTDRQQMILVESEKEKMRSNLLRAISHDLRTPLTGILGASSALLENEDGFDPETRRKLLSNIREDSQWLIRMVENLLSVTRIKQSATHVAKTPEAAEEIVAEAVGRIRKRYPARKITVRAPGDLLLVPMDGTLIVQVLINLIENAVKHSPEDSTIRVEVREEGGSAVFEVLDQGAGIDEDELPRLFDGYASGSAPRVDSARGMGIGLSICKSIIAAHAGRLEAANRATGGAAFRFSLPLKGA